MKHTVIIGNGISGITTARHLRKKGDDRITVVSGESDHFFSRTALMYIYMGHMKYENTKPYEDWFWEKNRIELVKGWVTNINTEKKEIDIEGHETLSFDHLVLATGSVPNKFNWPGQDLDGVSGLYSLQDLEYIEAHSANLKHAVIVGGGLIGVELAEMFLSRKIKVTFLVREENFWDIVLPKEEAEMVEREIIAHGIDLKLGTELKEIIGDDDGKVKQLITNHGETIDCEFVGLTVGVSPNIQWMKAFGIATNRGILVNEHLETNIPGIYAVGDCAEHQNPSPGRRPIEQVWYTGRMMGEVAANHISGESVSYVPGNWFNSAKFFNLEYQTYGLVASRLQESQEQFLWQSDDQQKCLRIVFDEKTTIVIGVNVFGIRMRHEIWDQWISDKLKVNEVMEKLEEANFDPEFFKAYEFDIRNKFNNDFDYMSVQNTKPSFLKRLFA